MMRRDVDSVRNWVVKNAQNEMTAFECGIVESYAAQVHMRPLLACAMPYLPGAVADLENALASGDSVGPAIGHLTKAIANDMKFGALSVECCAD